MLSLSITYAWKEWEINFPSILQLVNYSSEKFSWSRPLKSWVNYFTLWFHSTEIHLRILDFWLQTMKNSISWSSYKTKCISNLHTIENETNCSHLRLNWFYYWLHLITILDVMNVMTESKFVNETISNEPLFIIPLMEIYTLLCKHT